MTGMKAQTSRCSWGPSPAEPPAPGRTCPAVTRVGIARTRDAGRLPMRPIACTATGKGASLRTACDG